MYIGSKKIKKTFEEKDSNSINVDFEDGSSSVINKDLLEVIRTEEEGEGNVTDVVNHFFATKFVAELAMYGLSFYSVSGVSTSMQVLSHNLRESLFRETFKCSGGDDIPLKLITGVDNKK